MHTLMISLLEGCDSNRNWLPDALSAFARHDVSVVVVVRTPPDTELAAILQASSSEVIFLESPKPRWQAKSLGSAEHVVVEAKQLADMILGWRGGLLDRWRAADRLRLDTRLANLHARRLESGASREVDAIFEDVSPDLVLTSDPHRLEELPVLAAAYARRIPVVGLVRERAAVLGIMMPAVPFSRVVASDRRLADMAVHRGAHPFEVTVINGATSGRSFGGEVAEITLVELRLGTKPDRVRRANKRPRVLMIGSERLPIPPSKGGAVQTYVHEVSRRLVGQFDVCTCSPGPIEDTDDGVGRRALDPERYVGSVVDIVRREPFEIIHIFNRPRLAPDVAAAAPGTPVVVNLHNDHLADLTSRERVEVAADTHSFVTNGEFLRHRVLDLVPGAAGKVASIHSGVDVEAFHPRARDAGDARALRAEYGLSGGPLLAYVGRLVPEKGAHLLPAILERVRLRFADAQLLVVGSVWFGETTSDDYVRRMHSDALAAGDAMRFTGYLPPTSIPRVLAATDVLVAPGQWEEPFGRFAIEALGAGTPLVTSPRGGTGMAAVDGRTALVIDDYRRPEAYADAVCHLLSDSDLRGRLTRAGRRLVERSFTWDHTARRLAQLYDWMLDGH